jgi:hypothetical protein
MLDRAVLARGAPLSPGAALRLTRTDIRPSGVADAVEAYGDTLLTRSRSAAAATAEEADELGRPVTADMADDESPDGIDAPARAPTPARTRAQESRRCCATSPAAPPRWKARPATASWPC